MHENNGFVLGQRYVGCSGEFFVVEFVPDRTGVPKPVRMEEFADNQFGFGVLATDA
jgi:hypothetical protein